MPYFPYSDRDPSTGLYSGQTPLGGLLDRAAAAACGAFVPISRWIDSAYRAAGVPSPAAGFLSGYPLWDNICTPHGGAPSPPLVPGTPQFPVNCATFGTIVAFTNVGASIENPTWVETGVSWTCGDNVGRPISGLEWANFGGSTWGYVQTFQTADGLGTTQRSPVSTGFGDVRERVQIVSSDIQYCPGCGQPPPPPPPPELPEDDDPPDPDDPPIIIIDIDFPTQPGLPPISFPVTYSPVINFNTPINVQPALVLAPRIDLNPNFNFAPNFEFNIGGISIGGGGYPEPRPDITTTIDCDCPDPCPPGGDVDYERIARIVSDRLGLVRRIPGVVPSVEIEPPSSGTEVEIFLPLGTRGILYSLDLTEYTGGASFGSTEERSVFYAAAGWFGYDETNPGGERIFMNQPFGYLEAPAFASRFTAVARLGASLTVRAVVSADPPDP